MRVQQVHPAALPLLAFAVALPERSAAQEAQPETEPEIAWTEPHGREMAGILQGYYKVLIHSDMTAGCRADRGEVCMNGDHEDQLWRSSTPREPERIERFLRRISEAARSRPDDAVGFAQAVYAFVRLRPPEDALEVAGDCTVADWWCDLVLGMVHQRAGRAQRAERHFRSALSEADSALACRLTGIGELLDGSDREAYRRLSCPARADFERRFWWLTDPMISTPGNDRWAEHIARRFELVLHERLLGAIGHQHPAGHETAIVRRGHEDSWAKGNMPNNWVPPSRTGMAGIAEFMEFQRWTSVAAARYRFTPVSAIGDGLAALRYELDAGRTDEGYTPATYGPVFEAPVQFARFREGSSLFVAAAAELDDVPLPRTNTVLVLSEGPDSFPLVLGQVAGSKRPVFDALVDPAPALVGVESVARNRAVARARTGLLPLAAQGLVLSDPLLVEPAGLDLPAGRDEAVASMLGTTSVGSGTEMSVYFEIYGVAEGWPLTISLSIDGGDEGWVTRVLRALRVRPEARGPVVSWSEPASAATHSIALSLDIDGLDEGTYELRIAVTDPDGSQATSTRRFEVNRG